jgi:ribosomal protein S3
MWFTRGSMPLRIFDRYIDYYSAHAVTHLGTIGIKTWIYLTQFISLGG